MTPTTTPTVVVLRDGTRALIRPVEPDDKERLVAGLQQLSARSRYLRFHAPMERLTDEQLRYLTEVDGYDHVALVALNPDRPEEPGMGVARYVRIKGEPEVAEAAVTVLDRYQGKGLGTVLLEMLTERAADNGVRVLRNYVLAENEAMFEILTEAGATVVDDGAGVFQVDVPLPEDPAQPLGRLLQLLREFALGRLRTPWAGR
jgi:GNAT superfamily N-acetyltransferase